MRPKKNIENIIKNFDIDINADKDKKIYQHVEQTYSKTKQTVTAYSAIDIWRIIMENKMIRLTVVAAVIIAAIIGINQMGGSLDPSSVAWAQQAIEALEKNKAIVYRQKTIKVRQFSKDQVSEYWEKRYYAKDAYRRDLYSPTGNVLNTQWILPDTDGHLQHEVSYEYKCYWDAKIEQKSYYDDLMKYLKRHVGRLSKATRILGTEVFDGKKCVGFELAPGEYDGFTLFYLNRIWFDIETKLPARIERLNIDTDDPSLKLTIVHDQFNYYAEVPVDMFIPQIPQDFVNAHSDEIRNKGQVDLVYADVPGEIRDEIITAIKGYQSVIYKKHLETTDGGKVNVYPSDEYFADHNRWRVDKYAWHDKLQKTHLYNIEKQSLIDGQADNFRLTETVIDYENMTYNINTFKDDSYNRHPMENIMFLASMVNQADRVLENTVIEGLRCFGFEISAIKYGTNPPDYKHRLWLDEETNLPVRMEFERYSSDGILKIIIQDQFQWNPKLPEDTFKPIIPDDYEFIVLDSK